MSAQLRMQLAAADVDRVDALRSALKQNLREAAGRGADVQADFAGGIDAKMFERALQFETTASHEAGAGEHFDLTTGGDRFAGLLRFAAVDEHFARHD